jgi:hypothetical protein
MRNLASTHRGLRAMVQDWLARYGVAECCGIILALIGSLAMRRLTGNPIAAAYGGAWGETIGYAASIAWRDVVAEARTHNKAHESFGVRSVGRLLSRWVTEFGPSGLLDTFLIRPFAMGVGMHWFGSVRGLVAGKLAADILFYIPVVFMYERSKRL